MPAPTPVQCTASSADSSSQPDCQGAHGLLQTQPCSGATLPDTWRLHIASGAVPAWPTDTHFRTGPGRLLLPVGATGTAFRSCTPLGWACGTLSRQHTAPACTAKSPRWPQEPFQSCLEVCASGSGHLCSPCPAPGSQAVLHRHRVVPAVGHEHPQGLAGCCCQRQGLCAAEGWAGASMW